MKFFLALSLCTLPCFGQFYDENVSFNQLKSTKKPSGVKKAHFRMAIAHEVIYGTTDENRILEVYDAVIFLKKAIKRTEEEVWTTIPDLDKQYKKDREKARKDKHLLGIIGANSLLKKAMEATDPIQRRKNLHQVFNAYPHHIPTLMAVAKNEWELGNFQVGDAYLRRVRSMEPKQTHWPVLTLEAIMQKRTLGIEKGLDLLKKAGKYNYSKSNQASDLSKDWNNELDQFRNDPEMLYRLRAFKALKSLASKDKSGTATHYLGKLFQETGDLSKGPTLLAAAMKKQPDNYEFFSAWAYAASTWDKIGRKVRKLTPKFENEPGFEFFLSLNPKLPTEKRISLVEEALKNDPTNRRAHSILTRLRVKENEHKQLLDFLGNLAHQSDDVAPSFYYLVALSTAERWERGSKFVAATFPRFPKDMQFLLSGGRFIRTAAEKGHTQQREQVGYQMVTAALAKAEAFDFRQGAKLVEKAIPLFPDHPEVFLLAANLYYQGGHETEARPLYEKALEHFPENAGLYELTGDCFFTEDLMTKTIKHYQRAQQLDSERPSIERKLKAARKRKGEKIQDGIVSALAVVAVAAAAGQGGKIRPYAPHSMNGRPPFAFYSSNNFSVVGHYWGTEEVTGYGLDETAPLLFNLYNKLLEIKTKYGFETADETPGN